MTNFYISKDMRGGGGRDRYDILKKEFITNKITLKKAMEILQNVAQHNTITSTVYDLNNKTIIIKYLDNKLIEFNLDEEFKENEGYYYLEELVKENNKKPDFFLNNKIIYIVIIIFIFLGIILFLIILLKKIVMKNSKNKK